MMQIYFTHDHSCDHTYHSVGKTTLDSVALTIRWLWQFFDNNVGGQSMCAGGTTSLAENGITPHIIQGIRHWASPSWQIYICKHPVLLQAMLHTWPATSDTPPLKSSPMLGIHSLLICLCNQMYLYLWYTMLLNFLLYLYPHSSHCQPHLTTLPHYSPASPS